MARMIAIQADRIIKNIGYAISQKNNHGLSEAVGLITVGLLFPELRGSSQWEAVGRRTLEREMARQVYDDGSFVQHSMNYHRVMLHDCVWAIRLAEVNGRPFSTELRDRVAKAGEFLFEMFDSGSGRVPNYGSNDGALVLPLSSCDYSDYRATVQCSRFEATGSRVLDSGPWDEMLLWLYGEDALEAPRSRATPESRRFDAGGYYTVRGDDTWCLVRCHSYRDRPAHVDMLHVDLWHKGTNVLGDSGTYRYYVPGDPGVEKFFKDIGAHNTVEIDGSGPLRMASRFLLLPWPRGHCTDHRIDSWAGEHHAYDRPPWRLIHSREVKILNDGNAIITDRLRGSSVHTIRLRWHLGQSIAVSGLAERRVDCEWTGGAACLRFDLPDEMAVTVTNGSDDMSSPWSMRSDYYGAMFPVATVEASGRCQLPITMTTHLVFE